MAKDYEVDFRDPVKGDGKVHARRIEPSQISQANSPGIHNLFSNNFFTEITEAYLESPKIINSVIYAVTYYGTSSPIDDPPFRMHFDAINALKFFLYLDNTNYDNGAFMCLPGRHDPMREKREIEAAKNSSYSNIDTSTEVNLEDVVFVDGPPGTLFVFDTDIPHKAGWVNHGGQRRILRNASYTSKELDRQIMAMAMDSSDAGFNNV